MKKFLFTAFSGIYLLSVISLAANGQFGNANMQPSELPFLVKSVSENTSNMVDRAKIDSRVLRNFIKSYQNVSDEKWFELKDGFLTKFRVDDIMYMVAYGKKGGWLHTIRTYNENKLAQDLRYAVKSSYYDYHITLVQEVKIPLNPVTYVIHLEDKTKIINLRVCDGEMDEWQKMSKSE